MSNKKATFFLVLIFLFGLGVRIYRLGEIPSGFFCDEAANGFNAYMLAQKGTDEYGVSYPFFFRSLGDYRNPVTIYSMIPLIKLLGLNEFSVRLTNALYGALTIIVIFLLGKKLFNPEVALFSSLLLAISPWHIQFSRTGFEFVLLPFYFSLALLFFLKGLEKHWFFVPSAVCWGLTFYTYYPAQMVVPLFLVFLVIIYRRKIRPVSKKILLLSLVLVVVWFLPFFIGVQQGTILTRFKNVSIFETQPFSQAINSIFPSYLNHFSLSFLFTKGDIDFPGHFITRHSIRGMGQLYLLQLPLIIIGAYWLVKKAKKEKLFLLLLWFFIYPLGSIFTINGPYAHRSIIGVIPFHLLSGIGMGYLIRSLRKPVWLKGLTVFFLMLVISFSFRHYLFLYFKNYPLYSSDFWGWQYGPRETMKYFLTVKELYDDLYMSGEFNGSEIFSRFYDPQNKCQNKCKMGDFWRQPKIYNPSRRQLFSLSPEYLNNSKFKEHFLIKRTIYYPDGKVAFFIGEVVI